MDRQGSEWTAHLLKQDALGRVERLERGDERRLRRVADGGRIPLSRAVARLLLGRERRALEALAGLEGVPRALDADDAAERGVLLRSWIAGSPLHLAEELPADFFENLRALVRAVHARGVCHNDLHKEQNVLVDARGWPALVDFQLASVHARRGRLYESRCRDDLRHVAKHERRYRQGGRERAELPAEQRAIPRRSVLALVWRRTGKLAYNLVTRGLFGTRDGEPRRPSSGPWPRWTEPVGPRGSAS